MSTFTRGRRDSMSDTQQVLARVYDRLRKKQYRKKKAYAFSFPTEHVPVTANPLRLRTERVKFNPYLDGVRDALAAVQEELHD